MLSLRELRRAVRVLEKRLSGSRLARFVQTKEHELILSFLRSKERVYVLISCHPEFARICCLEDLPGSTSLRSTFYEYARAHLSGSDLLGIQVDGENRQVRFRIQTDSAAFSLILSILGARSNVYLVDAAGKLMHSMRPLDKTRRELKIGDVWSDVQGGAPSEGTDHWEDVPDDVCLETIGKHYEQLERKRSATVLGRRVASALAKEIAFLDRKAIHLREDLGEARQAEAYRKKGELLKSVLHTIRPGDDKAIATDYDTGEVFEIPLDPKISAAENLTAFFAHYQKESRGEKMIEQQLDQLNAVREELGNLENRVKEIIDNEDPDTEAIAAMAAQPKIRRLINRYFPSRKPVLAPERQSKKKGIPSRFLPKRYKTEDGLEIWVGRSDEGNDYLTTRLARGNDLFFHLEGYPGSHVVLRTEGRSDPPSRSLLDACELAVHFSKLKNASSADIHVAPIKEVKKPKGAKPGLVYVRRGKTIHLRRDPRRLEAILASRLDE